MIERIEMTGRALAAEYGEDWDDLKPKYQHMRIAEAKAGGFVRPGR